MLAVKSDSFVGDPPILMSNWIARTLSQNISELPFGSFFQQGTVLVPVPKSSLMRPNTLWVPSRIASAIFGVGLAERVSTCLSRIKAVPKAATSHPKERPKPADHYKSISVQKSMVSPEKILLIDDVITRGSTLLGAANRLSDVFPNTPIHAFAAVRTINSPQEFSQIFDPCIGKVTLRLSGDTIRRP
jgi:predicted amidophosphoribosyltransferase